MKTIQLTVLMAGLFLSAFTSEAQFTPILTNGLVAYYPFNGNANDVSGNGNNGSPNNIAYAADRFGNSNAAASFAGNSSSYIVINTTNLNLPYNFTVSVWINFQAGQGFEGPRIISTAGYEITTDLDPSARYVNLDGGTGLKSSNPVPAGVWNHIVGVWTSNQMTMYLNGVISSSVSNSLPIDYSHGWAPTIGVNSGAYENDNYAGLIDDVAIYNRALSAQEVSELYESFASGIITLPTITITGNSNQTYSIQYVTNLSSTNWTTLVSNIVVQSNTYLYPDTNSVGQAQRFYRVVAQ